LHHAPVPRIGGICLLISAALWAGFYSLALLARLAIPLLILIVVSLIDDKRHLPVLVRLSAHLLAAMLLLFPFVSTSALMLDATPGSLFLGAILILAVVWMINLYNFMDGANGLAGGMTLIGFASYGIAAGMNDNNLASAAFIISGAALGFLLFNFPKASVFMGDAGSVPLGFLAAAIGLTGAANQLWPWWFGLLIFSPFIVDASITLLRRMLRGEKFWQAHCEHYYQRLILSGWSHTKLALAAYALMLLCSLSAFFALNSRWQTPVLAAWVVIYLLIIVTVERRFSKNKN
jgi:UDP-N-acetylmuramyl pentapeptide phosphotransferase/UDP-N-acetylglucosamine-1-phosphate transferase